MTGLNVNLKNSSPSYKSRELFSLPFWCFLNSIKAPRVLGTFTISVPSAQLLTSFQKSFTMAILKIALAVLLVIQYASAMGLGGGLGGGFGGGYGMGVSPEAFRHGLPEQWRRSFVLQGVSKVTAAGVSEEATVTGMPRDCTGWWSTLPDRGIPGSCQDQRTWYGWQGEPC
ncbi:hypothetical protein CEXT_232051 [Caerostris extrusa]|uniref:Uncharacterized protein n=1 Tax=Caerostris extrusa TaxID=172846 RepID=A0AAV4Y737_CAEEX|nr:hypothetical protein CEXT_232051 [Caerostris extrusa]